MTNEQLKILLENQAALLRIAIEKAVELMPEGAEKAMEDHYIGKNFMAESLTFGKTEKDWEERPTGKHIALIPLYDHLDSIERQIDYFPVFEHPPIQADPT